MDKKQIIEDYLQGRHPMEQNSWELPSANELDNAEAEYDRRSLTPRPLRKERGLKFWLFAAAACVAGFVAIFLAPPREAEEQQPLALEEPVVNGQEPIIDSQLSTPLKGEMEGASQQPTVVKPKRTPKRKQVVLQRPVEEPLLAEAEVNASHLEEVERGAAEDVHPIHPEMNDPYLAIMEQMKDIRSRGERVRQEVAQLIDKH